jgi:hypothetical protein
MKLSSVVSFFLESPNISRSSASSRIRSFTAQGQQYQTCADLVKIAGGVVLFRHFLHRWREALLSRTTLKLGRTISHFFVSLPYLLCFNSLVWQESELSLILRQAVDDSCDRVLHSIVKVVDGRRLRVRGTLDIQLQGHEQRPERLLAS